MCYVLVVDYIDGVLLFLEIFLFKSESNVIIGMFIWVLLLVVLLFVVLNNELWCFFINVVVSLVVMNVGCVVICFKKLMFVFILLM